MESCNTESSLDLPLESLSLQPFLQSLHKEQWQEVRLGEIVDVKHGYAFAGKNITTEHTPNVLVTPGNFHIGGGFKSQKFKYFNGEIPKSFIFSTGDIIVTMTDLSKDGDTLGYSAKIPKDSEHIYLHNQRIGLLLFLRSDICKDFIYWLLRTKNYQAFIVNSATGTSVKHTSPKLIGEYRFPLPPLTTQQKIAEILSSFDDKIDLLHRQNKTLESLALTLFRHYFIDNPKRNEWEEKPLSEVCQIKNGFAFKSEEYKKIGIPVVRTTNFKNGFVENHNLVYLDENDKNKYSKYLLQVNDFLLVMVGASLGKYAIVTSEILPALQNQNMWNFRVLGSVSQYYLNYAMQEIIANNINTASGSAREFFQKSYFYKIPILIPPKNIMMKFHTQMDNFYHKTTNNRKQIQNLQAMRDMLLKAIFA
ncbi:hypothetical protein C826_01425 [Helicobacter bilis WiWa]|uniref:Type I restriction modification DNA specificity domain-containing protein n=6 Tax=Helicobacter bilis TaxID=37372 RepID=N2BNG6_9HELI|nr:restriction endonuclease subunit S [Helicobacter bilis]EMZ38389.1 hypothetical protein C826_01425 [Helicobacter bilis WiWa]